MDLYNDDCFNVFPKLKDKSIDLFVLDLPYGQTACKWDSCIDLTKMWVQIKRIMKPNAVILFYCTTKFGYKVIQSNEKWFRYDLIWKKSRKVGFLSANKMPLRQHENIYVFSDADDDLENKKNKELRSYAEKVKKYIGKSLKIIDKKIGNQGIHHFYSFTSTQFGIPIEKNYNKLIETYKINEMEGFIDYKTLKSKWDDEMVNTYNPQKTEGKPYTCKEGIKNKDDLYSIKNDDRKITINKGDRHPTSIIEHENIYVFSGLNEDNDELIKYSKKILKFIGKTKAEIKRNIKDADHFFRYSKDNFSMPTEETYNKLIAFYKINEMEGFIDYKDLDVKTKYNPQKTKGKPYKNGADKNPNNVYGITKEKGTITKTDRHPTSIIEHENVYVFGDYMDHNTEINNKHIIDYSKQILKYIGKTKAEIKRNIKDADHFFRYSKDNFSMPTEETYNKLIAFYKIDKMEGFIDYKTLKGKWEKELETTYNPQKTEGTPYKTKGKGTVGVYNSKRTDNDNKGDRHPTSIIEHENVYVFSDADDDLENKKNKELRSYAEKVKKYIGKSLKIIDKKIGNQGIHHFYSFTSTQFGIPIEKNYNKLIETYKINEMDGFIDYKTLKSKWDDEMVNTYNPQKTVGTPYKSKEHIDAGYYRKDSNYKRTATKDTTNRHPTSIYPETIETTILEHNNPVKSLHRTQKPTSLCEWLIKTYSNEGDTVMDFTMGSGTTGEACKNTKRKFIGVEMDKDIFKVAKDRLNK